MQRTSEPQRQRARTSEEEEGDAEYKHVAWRVKGHTRQSAR